MSIVISRHADKRIKERIPGMKSAASRPIETTRKTGDSLASRRGSTREKNNMHATAATKATDCFLR